MTIYLGKMVVRSLFGKNRVLYYCNKLNLGIDCNLEQIDVKKYILDIYSDRYIPGPLEYADLIFDKIEEIVEANRKYISIARTPGDLYEDKRHGRKSIMLGIENGLALNGQLQNLQHFAQRGVVYMTLCHNGDNEICDSAKGCNTHGGVSRFGEQVIREMNRLGIMVDLSHAAEKSFYDALEISSMPIV